MMTFCMFQDLYMDDMMTNGYTYFCLSQYEIKCKTKSGVSFMLQVNQVYHYTLANHCD